MDVRKKLDLEGQLLQARRESLERAESFVLRPLGKLWGMDVFVWHNPSVYDLSATLSAFPFPVFLLSNRATLQELAQVDPETLRTVQWCGQYDHPQLNLPGDVMADLPLITGTEQVQDTLRILREMKAPKHIVLYTYKGNEWKTNLEIFETFIKRNQ